FQRAGRGRAVPACSDTPSTVPATTGAAMSSDTSRFFVITGGPGAGKSTLVEALERHGFACSTEAGRAGVREQGAVGGNALPWRDPRAFAERMLEHELRSYRLTAETKGLVFFDRGLPDIVDYLRLTGVPVPAPIELAARRHRYGRRVFVAPLWPEI